MHPPLGARDFVKVTEILFAGLQPHIDIAGNTTAQSLFS